MQPAFIYLHLPCDKVVSRLALAAAGGAANLTPFMPPVLLPADSTAAAQARRRFWVAWLLSCSVLLAIGGLAIGAAYWFMKGPVQASGGAYFFRRVELPVPQFFQGDPRWAEEGLGETDDTLGSAGCAVAS